jgi:lipoic acid synthetase
LIAEQINHEIAAKAAAEGRLPPWIRVKVHTGGARQDVSDLVRDMSLNTVCQSAKCPNLAECWHKRSATFMILGNRCTRACTFCAIASFKPEPVDPEEAIRVAESAATMGLNYVVLTSVDRDDLADKGAAHFVATIEAIRSRIPHAKVEILTPDFKGRLPLIDQVVAARPLVFNHNLETCERLTKPIRSGGRYDRSLAVLAHAKDVAGPGMATKSGIMVGLGETDDEVLQCLRDLRSANVDILTIGQYLPPSKQHWPLERYVTPEQFDDWADQAKAMGFAGVASAPLVRSSYRAEELAEAALAQL